MKSCKPNELEAVLLRIANPKEYNGDQQLVRIAINSLNHLLRLEGLCVRLNGITPIIEKVPIDFSVEDRTTQDLQPLPPPDFLKLRLEPGIGELLGHRWTEAQLCVESKAYLAGLVMMGSLLEGMILGVIQKNPQIANQARSAPKDSGGKTKPFWDWSLSQMIDVAHEVRWIDLDVKRFSHSLRQFRNLIHPYEQLSTGAHPDEDTYKISWLVVQAATNDLAKTLTEPKTE